MRERRTQCGFVRTTAVTVRSFVARRSGRAVELRWRTASDVGNLGFNVYRDAARLNERLIPAGRTSYRYLDRPPRGGSFVYRLQGVKLDGSRAWLGSVRVRFR